MNRLKSLIVRMVENVGLHFTRRELQREEQRLVDALRDAYAQAETARERSVTLIGEIAPALSLELCNVRLKLSRSTPLQRPLLGQIEAQHSSIAIRSMQS